MTHTHAMAICADDNSDHIIGHWDKCFECKTKIFISQSTVNNIQENYDGIELRCFCIQCGRREYKKTQHDISPMTQEQLKEIELHGLDETDWNLYVERFL